MLQKLHIYFVILTFFAVLPHSRCQQLMNGNFDGLTYMANSYAAYDNANSLRINQLVEYVRLINFPPKGPYPSQDSMVAYSQGYFRWAYFDSTDTLMFRHTPQYPNGIFADCFPIMPRSQFNSIPFHNRVSFCFVNFDIKDYGPQFKYGYSSLKLSIIYSTNLIPGKKYLLTMYDMAMDSVLSSRSLKTLILDSLFIGNALDGNSVGDTIAITHPQRGIWNKRFIPFTSTKPYSHFTVGNCSAQSSNIAGNMIDECYIFPIQSTSADTLLACAGDSVLVEPLPLVYKTEWHDGDTSAYRYLSASNWFIRYSYPDSNSVVIDSFYVLSVNSLSHYTDTTLCEHIPLVLSSSLVWSAAKYTWSSGDTTASISTLANNTIWCQTDNQQGCIITDSFFITRSPAIQFQLGSDTLLCYGETKIIGPTVIPGLSYKWNTTDTLSQLAVSRAGKFSLTVSNQYCSDSASINISAKGIIQLNLPIDTVFCFDDLQTLLLDAGNEFTSYLWKPTGERTQSIYATMPQRYLVFVKDTSNCDGSGSTLVSETCPDFMFIPNAFTPNGDGLNDVFLPRTRNLVSYNMSIVNRWGEILFITQNPQQGWDGKNAQADVYVVIINYKVDGKEQQMVKQNVSLLR
jgi:gliding motility-associated-like protein